MENILFYPTLTPDMIENAGLIVEKYSFAYEYQSVIHDLQQKGTSTLKLSDPIEIWNVEEEGLIIDKNVKIAYPELLKGPDGVVCKDAEYGICIIWTNNKLSQTGIILPDSDLITPQGRVLEFHYSFPSAMLSGDLELVLSMYVKSAAKTICDNEVDLINEEGVSVGEIERVFIDFKSIYMEFPIEEYSSDKEPLWWVEFYEWEDPKTVDMFSKDSFCLFLNPYYDACPAPSMDSSSASIKNFDLLVDILSQTYLMIFMRLGEEDLKATKKGGIELANNSICSIMHQFIEDCVYSELHWESPEKLLKSIQINIRNMLLGD